MLGQQTEILGGEADNAWPHGWAAADSVEVPDARPLAGDTARFFADDSSDSIQQLLQDDWQLGRVGSSSGSASSSNASSSHSSSAWLCGSPPSDACGRSRKRASPRAAAADSSDRQLTPKRRRLQPLADLSNRQEALATESRRPQLQRCMSEMSAVRRLDSAKIDKAIASIDSLNLVGDSAQQHSLPTVKEMNYGIRYVTGATVSALLDGRFEHRVGRFLIVDCRFPYEFAGGHIRGAVNMYTQDSIVERLLQPRTSQRPSDSPVLIFHCEFSSERAPKLARFLRQRDRELNSCNYPDLHFPEVYVLKGGYKSFFQAHKSQCTPLNYRKMSDPGFKEELTHFQKATKAWERQNSRTKHSQLERLAASRLL